MAHSSSSRTLTTLQELNANEIPVLRLRGPPPTSTTDSGWKEWAASAANAITQWDFLSVDNVHEAIEESILDPETTIRNCEKVDKMFDKMVNGLEKQRAEVKEKMVNLTPAEQDQVLTYWGTVAEWMMDVLTWLKVTFDSVLEKIKQGYKIVKKALKEALQWIIDAMKKIMT